MGGTDEGDGGTAAAAETAPAAETAEIVENDETTLTAIAKAHFL